MNNQKINSMSYENRVKQLTNGILLASGLYDKNSVMLFFPKSVNEVC